MRGDQKGFLIIKEGGKIFYVITLNSKRFNSTE